MRKSLIFETIYKELLRIGKSNKSFTRNDLRNIISKHQKFSAFIYKHSDLNNKGKMTLFFKRGKKVKNVYSFILNFKILKEYKKSHIIQID